MQRLEVSCAVRLIYGSLGVKRLNDPCLISLSAELNPKFVPTDNQELKCPYVVGLFVTHLKIKVALLCIITQWVALIYYRRFAKIYRSHLQGFKNKNKVFFAFEDGTDMLSRNVVKKKTYHYSLCNNPEERSSHPLRSHILKSHTF